MLNLGSTTSLLKLVTSAAGTIHVHVSFVDRVISTAVDTPDDVNAIISTAATTTILGSPASGNARNAKLVNVRNAHATVANTVTGLETDGTTEVELFDVALVAGEWLTLNDAGVLFVYNSDGSVKAGLGLGRLVVETLLTSGTSMTTGPSTNKVRVRVQGAGGGGGGCTSVASAAAGAGGGGAGGYAEKTFIVTPNTAYAYTIGAAGTGASGAAGNNGGNSTYVVSGVTVTAFGGTGGPVGTAATTLVARAGGAGGIVSTNGDINAGGAPGNYGVTLIVATPIVAAGSGGSSQFGGGGVGIVAVGNGVAATGLGAGGGGSATGASAVRTGGSGTGGCITVEEYS